MGRDLAKKRSNNGEKRECVRLFEWLAATKRENAFL